MTHGKKFFMILLDSNIVIYLRDPKWGDRIARRVADEGLSTCNVVIAEVLGFKSLDKVDARYFELLFAAMKNHPFNDMVTKKVIEIRKVHTIQLPDAIIAATVLVNDLVLWTHNIEDFGKIADLRLFDPLEQ